MARWVFPLIGAVVIMAALGIQFGYLPSANVTGCGTPTTPCHPPEVLASFAAVTDGYRVFANDTSYVNDVPAVVGFVWGDGTDTVGQPLGARVSHLYASAGTYTIRETTAGTLTTPTTSVYYSSNATVAVTVPSHTSGSGSGNGSLTCTALGTCGYLGPVQFTYGAAGNLTLTFTDTTTTHNVGGSVTWSFGDNTTATAGLGQTVTHQYARLGSYVVNESVTVSGIAYPNNPGTWSGNDSRVVQVGTPPTPTPASRILGSLNETAILVALLGIAIILGGILPGLLRIVGIALPLIAALALLLYIYVATLVGGG